MENEFIPKATPLPTGLIEKISLVLLPIGLALKLAHIPFAGPILTVALSSLAMAYTIGSFQRASLKEDEKPFTLLNIATGLILALTCIGILFRLMYWPFGQNHLTIACIGLPIIFGWLFHARKNVVYPETARVYALKSLRVAVFFTLAAILYLTPVKTQIEFEHPDDPEMARLKYKHITNPQNTTYKQEYLDYRNTKRNH
jgi:hypothetical protein